MKYFDYAATTPLDSEAAEVYVKAATDYYGNTGSLHDIGSTANDILDNCRSEFARLLSVDKEGIYFTSGGSESNYLGIQALLSAKEKKGFHIISTLAEHSSIQSTLKLLSQQEYEITRLPFNENGCIDIEMLKNSTREDTVLVVIQHGNSEIGSLQPIKEIGEWCEDQQILFHCDCVHTFGKVDLRPISKMVDSISISSHKFYGPKGIGVAYVNPHLLWKPYYPGTTHENGFRPGTVNVPAIAAMTVAAQKAIRIQEDQFIHAEKMRQKFLSVIGGVKEKVTIYNSSEGYQLPHTLALRIHGIEGQWVMLECNRRGFAVSTGSACQTGLTSPSKTMVAMNVPDKRAKEMIRITFGRDTVEQDVMELGQVLIDIIHDAP